MSKINLSQIAQPSAPAADKLEIFYDSTLNKLCAVDESANVAVLGGFATKDYRLIRVVDINQGTTTFTPTTGAKALYVECFGAGGGGGGVATAVTNSGAAGGGGSGAYSASWLTAISTSYACVVGALGAGGTAGANNGSVGADTTFDGGTITAKGGLGGIADTIAILHVGGLGGAGGAAGSGAGDTLFSGTPGEAGLALAAAQGVSGRGGNSPFGGGGNSLKTQSAGAAATGFGSGGSGGCAVSGGASVAGGNGADGLIRVWEFA